MIHQLNDNIIGDIIGIEINADMTVSTLYALETIFFLRLQLAQVSGDESETLIADLCRVRYGQILEVLSKKYPRIETVNEKIEILERIETITLFLHNEHSYFALEKAAELEDLPELTCSQQLRLSWMPSINASDCETVVASLLHQAKDAFDIKTLADIDMFASEGQRQAVMALYMQQFYAALQTNNVLELAKLLSISTYWNNDPSRRPLLVDAASQAANTYGLPLPEKRVNAIAAAIYAQIDALLLRDLDTC